MNRCTAVNVKCLPLLLLASLLLLCGCQGLPGGLGQGTESTSDDDYHDLVNSVLTPKPIRGTEPYQNKPIVVDEIAPKDTAKLKGPDFPENRQRELPKVRIAEYPSTLIKGVKDPEEKVNVVLNLDGASLTEIVPLFAELLGFSYQIDPGVKGAVTMVVDSEMTARESWEMFEHILWLSGAYASRNPGFIDILPFSKMSKDKHLLLPNYEPQPNVEVAFIPIYKVKSADIIKNIQPFMTDGATVTDLTADNVLLIVEAPANMPKLRELIDRLDSPGEAEWPHICIQCHEVDADDLLAELQDLLPVLGYPVTNKGPSGGQIKLTSLPRLRTIVASAALPEVLQVVERWAQALDQASTESREDIYFYDVQHSTAEKLNEMLQVFFNTDSTTSSKTSTSKSTAAKGTATTGTTTKTTDTTPVTRPTTGNRSRNQEETEGESVFDSQVVVYVDQDHNRLSIQTTPRAWPLIQAMLERHDINPRQVLVEARIVEVTLSKDTEFGFAYAVEHSNWQGSMSQMGTDGNGTARTSWTSTNSTWTGKDAVTGLYPANPTNFTSSVGGVALGYLQGDSMAFVNAVAGVGNSKVLSAPQITALNGMESKINIGRKVAIKTTEYNDDYKSSYEYQDTGTILTVTPYITAGNDVRLDLQQEVSSVIDGTGGDGSPDISNKQLNTTLVIPDGGTAIMGGLIDTTNSEGHTGIPFLKDIPWLGHLFRTNQRSNSRNELLVLVTVNVLEPRSDTTSLLKRYQAALREIREQLDQ